MRVPPPLCLQPCWTEANYRGTLPKCSVFNISGKVRMACGPPALACWIGCGVCVWMFRRSPTLHSASHLPQRVEGKDHPQPPNPPSHPQHLNPPSRSTTGQEELLPRRGRRAVLRGGQNSDRGKGSQPPGPHGSAHVQAHCGACKQSAGLPRSSLLACLGLLLLPLPCSTAKARALGRVCTAASHRQGQLVSQVKLAAPLCLVGWRVCDSVCGRPPVRRQRLLPR